MSNKNDTRQELFSEWSDVMGVVNNLRSFVQNDAKYADNDIDNLYDEYNSLLSTVKYLINKTHNFMLENMVEEGLGG